MAPPVPLRRAGGFALPAPLGRCGPGCGVFGVWSVPVCRWGAVRRSGWLLWHLACACVHTRAYVGACTRRDWGAASNVRSMT
nr:MAG TPA: hypothetical protein [Caudoviricetes sp.]